MSEEEAKGILALGLAAEALGAGGRFFPLDLCGGEGGRKQFLAISKKFIEWLQQAIC